MCYMQKLQLRTAATDDPTARCISKFVCLLVCLLACLPWHRPRRAFICSSMQSTPQPHVTNISTNSRMPMGYCDQQKMLTIYWLSCVGDNIQMAPESAMCRFLVLCSDLCESCGICRSSTVQRSRTDSESQEKTKRMTFVRG